MEQPGSEPAGENRISKLSISAYSAIPVGFFFTLAILLSPAISFGQHHFADTIAGGYDVIPNVTYKTVGDWSGKLDLYLPVNSRKTNPVLIWIHGGGWTQSSKEQELLYILPYLEMGWAVVNVEYRLAAVALAPAAVDDCRCALGWVVANASKYKFDVSKIVVSGISAGGHLALMTGMLVATPMDPNCSQKGAARPAAIINWFGPSDVLELIEGPRKFDQAVAWLGTRPDNHSLARLVSPLTHVVRGVPPVITIHGDRDDLIPYSQSARLNRQLRKAGVANQLVTIRGRGHGDFTRAEWQRAFAAIRKFLSVLGVMKGSN